jgi:hypothetical protein
MRRRFLSLPSPSTSAAVVVMPYSDLATNARAIAWRSLQWPTNPIEVRCCDKLLDAHHFEQRDKFFLPLAQRVKHLTQRSKQRLLNSAPNMRK